MFLRFMMKMANLLLTFYLTVVVIRMSTAVTNNSYIWLTWTSRCLFLGYVTALGGVSRSAGWLCSMQFVHDSGWWRVICLPSCPWVLAQPTGGGKGPGEAQMKGFYGHITPTRRLELRHGATQNYKGVECLERRGSRCGEYLASLCLLVLLREIEVLDIL